jgi:predicted transcriptional regulator
MAILEACRTPTVQHWIMVKARLGYDTFWKHMNMLVTAGMMETSNDGYKTLYYVNQKGLAFLDELEASQQ